MPSSIAPTLEFFAMISITTSPSGVTRGVTWTIKPAGMAEAAVKESVSRTQAA